MEEVLQKYGFTLVSTNDGIKTYETPIDRFKSRVVVTVLESTYTVRIKREGESGDLMVANRYDCTTSDELNFLLINGRAGGKLYISNHST